MKTASLVLLLVPLMALAVAGTTTAIEQPAAEGRKVELQPPGITIGPAQNQAQTLRHPVWGEVVPPDVPRTANAGTENRSREEGGPVVKLSGALVPGGFVSFFTSSADGQTVVYAANQDAVNVTQLYSVPIGGGVPTQLSAIPTGFCTADPSIACTPPLDAVCGALTTCPAYAGVGATSGLISSAGTRVVYLADQDTRDLVEFYSVPIGGGASTKLNAFPLTTPATWGLNSDGATAVYFGISASGNVELYGVPIAGPAASSVQLSSAGLNASGNVDGVFLVPGGARILYFADQDPLNDDIFDLYTVPIGGPNTAAIKLNSPPAFSGVTFAVQSPDNSRVVYTADEDTAGRIEIYSVPALGPSGTAVKLNVALPAGADVVAYAISPDSSHVSWAADATTDQQFETFSRVIDGTSPENPLSGPMTPGGSVGAINISPDSLWTVFQGDVLTDQEFELFSAPTDGSAGFMLLHDTPAPGEGPGVFTGSGTPVYRGRAIYPLFHSTGLPELFSVPVDGTQAPLMLNNTAPAGGGLFNGFIPNNGNLALMGFAGFVDTVGVVDGYTVPISRSQPPRKFNTGGDVDDYAITGTEAHVVYTADQDTVGVIELYARALDSDGDGVLNASDNCHLIANPGQLEQILGQTILASSKTTFSWPTRVDVKFVRGPLDQVGSYVTDDTGSVPEANSLTDTSVPGVGAGSYHSVAPDCAGGSHQTTLGAEPGRGALP